MSFAISRGNRHADVPASTLNKLRLRNAHVFAEHCQEPLIQPADHRRVVAFSGLPTCIARHAWRNPGCLQWAWGRRPGAADGISGLTRGRVDGEALPSTAPPQKALNKGPEMGHPASRTPANPGPLRKFRTVLSPPSIPMPCWSAPSCRMDRERFEAGGREWPLRSGAANVSRASPEEDDGNAGSAGGALSFGNCSRPSHRAEFLFPACGRAGTSVSGPCGGHGVFFAPGSVPEYAAQSQSLAVRPNCGRGGTGRRALRGAGEVANLRALRG